jgi:hypothetical protein
MLAKAKAGCELMHSRITLKIACLAAAGLLGAVAAPSSLAQSSSPGSGVILTSNDATPAQHLLNDKWVIQAGTFLLSSSVTSNLNGNANLEGKKVNFDQDFGGNGDVNVIRGGILWRWKPRHHLVFQYFHNRITRTRTLDKDIAWGDYNFLANGAVSMKNTFTIYELSYEYAFLRKPTYEIAGSAGIHFVDQHLSLSGNATVTQSDGTVQSASFQTSSSHLPAPLPVIGVRGGWAFAPNWYLEGAAQVFKVKITDYDGSWWDLRGGVTWMYNRHVGISAGYEKFIVHVNVDKTNFNGSLNLSYQGLLANVTATF